MAPAQDAGILSDSPFVLLTAVKLVVDNAEKVSAN
jgi:hypothetical protein